jgi:segregation and condensation protein B
VGRSEALGRPLLYGTTQFFLQHFGFRGIDDLPRSEELPIVLARRETEPVSDAPEAQTSAL